MKNNKGITLIALVITIIVMLILVTVTIRVATDGNLFTHAANAVKGTKTAIAGENNILNDELDKSIEDIVAEQTGIIHFTIGTTQYSAENGMTWRQWVNSKYNTAEPKFSIYNNGVRGDNNYTVDIGHGRVASCDTIIQANDEYDLLPPSGGEEPPAQPIGL